VVIRERSPNAQDFVNRRYRQRGVVNESERAKNRNKSKVRAKVEHPIGVIERVFGFVKVRYHGLKKNTHCLFVTCALANLFSWRAGICCAAVGVICRIWPPTVADTFHNFNGGHSSNSSLFRPSRTDEVPGCLSRAT
jgi:hypothetical protein